MKSVRKGLGIVILCGLVIGVNGCTKSASDVVLAEIGPEKLSLAEYERIFAKNNGGWEAAKNAPVPEKEKFLNLLVKYRLKLLDAYRRGLDKDPEIAEEMKGYRSSLAASFFLEREVVNPALQVMYERRKELLRASHILISIGSDSPQSDTVSAWEKAVEITKLAKRGEDFAKLAEQFSEDYSTRQSGGDLYYFTSGLMVPEFEDACYQLQVGEVSSQPVRTPFGYHVIKLKERMPPRGQIRASHIMIRFETASPTPEDTLKAYNEIKALQDSLQGGANFGELAQRHSQDAGSAHLGGDLGFFERRRAVQSFDEAAFSLKVGEFSEIVRTPYGYHLIRVTDEKPLPPFREMKQELRELYRTSRFTYDYEKFLQGYKKTVNFKFHDDVIDTLLAHAHSSESFGDDSWDQSILPTDRQKQLLSFDNESLSLDSVITIMKEDVEFNKMELNADNIYKALKRIAEKQLVRHRTRNIEVQFPEFRGALREYEEGILLYKSEQQQVWNKISSSDSLLRDYFERHRERYRFPARVNIAEIFVASDSAWAASLVDSVRVNVDFDDLAARYTERVNLREKKGEWGFRPVYENDLTAAADTMEIGEISGILRFDGYSIIKVLAKEQARPKTYEEALPEVAGQYHDHTSKQLEEEWLENLHKEFDVRVRYENLSSAFAKPPEEQED